jgi:hypothetical protein
MWKRGSTRGGTLFLGVNDAGVPTGITVGKTTLRDGDQLVLYAEYVRRAHDGADCTGAFDEYRLVPNLQRVRKPAFRRTPVPVSASCVPATALRYQRAWEATKRIRGENDAVAGDECWFCRPHYYGGWG